MQQHHHLQFNEFMLQVADNAIWKYVDLIVQKISSSKYEDIRRKNQTGMLYLHSPVVFSLVSIYEATIYLCILYVTYVNKQNSSKHKIFKNLIYFCKKQSVGLRIGART